MTFRIGVFTVAGIIACGEAALAQSGPTDLTRVTLEELLQTTIISASKKEERVEDVAASITVLTRDDIARSGVHTLPELFRLVPGMQVARVSASNWAISVRGFNDLFADKVLVLIDGRSIFNRRFNGVFWDTEDLLLDDIERIEVVRGSGGAVWGASAVNGVINIVTRSAKDTAGGLVRAGAVDRGSQTAARYGWSFGDVAMRLSTQWSDHGASLVDRNTSAGDAWRSSSNAMRVDWTHGQQAFIGEANFLADHSHPGWRELTSLTPNAPESSDASSDRYNASLLGRWTYTGAAGGIFSVQSFYSRRHLDDSISDEVERIGDVDVQYQRAFGRHDIVVGGGYRDNEDQNAARGITYRVTPEFVDAHVTSLYAQDEVSLGSRVKVSTGARVERDNLSGWSFQPSVRGIWMLDESRQRVWGAVSRAVKQPVGNDLGIRVNTVVLEGPGGGLPLMIGFIGNPALKSEALVDVEGGYRVDLASKVSVDVTVFRGRYTNLKTSEPLAPIFEATPGPPHLFIATQYANLLEADTSGVEVTARWAPFEALRLDGSFSGFRVVPHVDPASQDAVAATTDVQSPARQWQAHAWFNTGRRSEINLSLYHVGEIRSISNPAYTRVDANLKFALSDRLSVIATGENLFDALHPEFPYLYTGTVSTSIPRTGGVQLLWKF